MAKNRDMTAEEIFATRCLIYEWTACRVRQKSV